MLRGSALLTIGLASRISQKDAQTIAIHTVVPVPEGSYQPNVISATMELCKQDKKVRAYLLGMANQSAYLNLAVACGSLALGIMVNHNMVPPMFTIPSKVATNGTTTMENPT